MDHTDFSKWILKLFNFASYFRFVVTFLLQSSTFYFARHSFLLFEFAWWIHHTSYLSVAITRLHDLIPCMLLPVLMISLMYIMTSRSDWELLHFTVYAVPFVGSKTIINGHIGEDDNLLAFPPPWWKLTTQSNWIVYLGSTFWQYGPCRWRQLFFVITPSFVVKVPMDPGFTLTVEDSEEIPFGGLGFFLGLGNSHRWWWWWCGVYSKNSKNQKKGSSI
jgi:hypothetical protein